MPYAFGTESKLNLMGVHPKLVSVAHRAIAISEQDFGVHDGVRTLVEQQKLLAKGAAKTLNSKHLPQADGYGHAIDLVPFINGKLRWEWGPIYFIATAVLQAAKELKVDLRWGGAWDCEFCNLPVDRIEIEQEVKAYCERRRNIGKSAFIDGPHFELK